MNFGVCETVTNGTSLILDCLSGDLHFCCRTERVKTWNNATSWAKKCCSEVEFVQQNM